MSATLEAAPKTANGDIEEFEAFCGELTIEDGTQLQLEPFQRMMFADYFAGVRETLILISKKNGKSSILGALALYHLMVVPDAECVIAAASRDQAAIILRQIRGFIRRNARLGDVLSVKQREIEAADGGRIRVLASDVDTADGVIVTLACVDELHRHKSDEFYGILRDGLGPRDGQMVTISTAADSLHTPLGVLRSEAYARGGIERDGAYRCARSTGMVLHEWALDPEDDCDDIELVKLANPASWQTVEALAARHDSPSMRPWQWKRFACGLWVGGEDAAVSDREWANAAVPGLELDAATVPVIGIDLARREDCTAVIAVGEVDGEYRLEPLAIIEPPNDGTYIAEEEIWAPLDAAAERWPTATFVGDPALGADIFLERLEREHPNVTVATFGQKAAPLARMAALFTEKLAAGALKHPDDPALNAHVLAAGQRPVGEGWRFVKQRKKKLPIDALIAAAMALWNLAGEEPKPQYGRASW